MAGASRRQCLESHAGEQLRAACIPRIRKHKAPGLMQRPERFALLLDGKFGHNSYLSLRF